MLKKNIKTSLKKLNRNILKEWSLITKKKHSWNNKKPKNHPSQPKNHQDQNALVQQLIMLTSLKAKNNKLLSMLKSNMVVKAKMLLTSILSKWMLNISNFKNFKKNNHNLPLLLLFLRKKLLKCQVRLKLKL